MMRPLLSENTRYPERVMDDFCGLLCFLGSGGSVAASDSRSALKGTSWSLHLLDALVGDESLFWSPGSGLGGSSRFISRLSVHAGLSLWLTVVGHLYIFFLSFRQTSLHNLILLPQLPRC